MLEAEAGTVYGNCILGHKQKGMDNFLNEYKKGAVKTNTKKQW
jgi:hypothetical protein